MIEIKGDKQPVGLHENMQSFNCITYQYTKGDLIYMFSDGYADQFGGPKGKKYMYKSFKKTVLKNCQLPMSEQKEQLNQIFLSWKESIEQVDDVVIIGVKL